VIYFTSDCDKLVDRGQAIASAIVITPAIPLSTPDHHDGRQTAEIVAGALPITDPLSTIPEPPVLSIVIAVLNEAENVASVCAETLTALGGVDQFEIVFIDDGSTDNTAARISALRLEDPRVRLVRHDRRCGKSAALRTGITTARAAWIATMDGDGQNDPNDIPRMLRLAREATGAAPLVAGIRVRRNDTLSRRIATRFANGLRQAVLSDHCPDTGCGLKLFRRDDFLRIPVFEGMHRFLPALFQAYCHPLICTPVAHRPRLLGSSKYTNLGRAMVGIGDMLGVIWLRNRTRLPTRVTEL
jgi:dolichol-phosphate mannosyltransferase